MRKTKSACSKTLVFRFLALITVFLLVGSIPAARLLRPERVVFLRTDVDPGAQEWAVQWEKAVERLRDSATIKLGYLAGQCGIDLAERFAPDGKADRLTFIGRGGGFVRSLRAWVGKTDDRVLDIVSGPADTTLVCTLRTMDGETLAIDTVVQSVPTATVSRALLRTICLPVYPTAVLMDNYHPHPHDAYLEGVNRLRLYRAAGALQKKTGVFSCEGAEADARAATMGIVCEGFARATGDTAALRRADGYFRCAGMPAPADRDTMPVVTADAFIARFLDAHTQLPPQCRQLILVYNDTAPRVSCVFRRYEKQDGCWREVAPAIPANAGRNGIAPYDEKREGDGRSPSGAYSLGLAFGYRKDIDIAWPFLAVGKNHCWISDPQHPDYNRMTDRIPSTDDFEYLRRPDDAYKYAVVVEYNTHPVKKYRGSAIFFHIEKGFDRGSSGCITVDEASILEVLHWLDPECAPCMLIATLPHAGT